MDKLIASGSYLNVHDFMDKFEISEATANRDLDALRRDYGAEDILVYDRIWTFIPDNKLEKVAFFTGLALAIVAGTLFQLQSWKRFRQECGDVKRRNAQRKKRIISNKDIW